MVRRTVADASFFFDLRKHQDVYGTIGLFSGTAPNLRMHHFRAIAAES